MPRYPACTVRRAYWPACVMAAIAIMLCIASPARAQVVVLVDGQPITELDIKYRTKFLELSSPDHKAPSRQEVVDGLIDELLELREAKKYSIDPTTSDVNQEFNSIAHNMGVDGDGLEKILTNAGSSAETFKQRLRAQIAWGNLVRGRYKASLEIPDSDVEAELKLHEPADVNQVGYEYILRPIVMIVPKGSPDSAFEARKREADALRTRFTTCADGIAFARGLPEVAVRDPVSKSSSDLQSALRSILDSTEIGHLTPPEQTSEGIQMFAVCTKKSSKTDAPGFKEAHDKMFEKKFGAKAKSYLAELRSEAMIEYKQSENVRAPGVR